MDVEERHEMLEVLDLTAPAILLCRLTEPWS